HFLGHGLGRGKKSGAVASRRKQTFLDHDHPCSRESRKEAVRPPDEPDSVEKARLFASLTPKAAPPARSPPSAWPARRAQPPRPRRPDHSDDPPPRYAPRAWRRGHAS